ncbi:hypothetical protein LZ554_004415 [Drepanopeziza brunnea f. sp. 'monogermtubi']|nr:hypothetical protein LZ554_004415 [Drepanopeziza brunnea f. sp. 'monogermtubi']
MTESLNKFTMAPEDRVIQLVQNLRNILKDRLYFKAHPYCLNTRKHQANFMASLLQGEQLEGWRARQEQGVANTAANDPYWSENSRP